MFNLICYFQSPSFGVYLSFILNLVEFAIFVCVDVKLYILLQLIMESRTHADAEHVSRCNLDHMDTMLSV